MYNREKPVVAHSIRSWLPLTMTWVYNQLKYLKNFSPIILTDSLQHLEQFPWSPIYSFPNNKCSYFAFRLLKRLGLRSYPSIYDKAIKQNRPFLLHSHFGDRGWYDLPIAEKYGLKHIVSFYGFDVGMLPFQNSDWKNRYRLLFETSDFFLCEGPHMATCLSDLGCPKEKVKIQRLGIEVNKINFVPRKIADDGLIRILIVGTFTEKKGITYALEAVGLIRKRYPNIRVTIIGDSTGAEKQEIEKRRIWDIIKRYSLELIVTMLGFQPHHVLMAEAYKHHIFLSPSVTASDGDTEGGAPVTIIEMAASGMPIISTIHCDIPEVVKNNRTGYLVPERDIGALSNALENIIITPDNWKELGWAARQHIENNFEVRSLIRQLEELYKELLGR